MMKKILGSALVLAMTASVASAGYTPGPMDQNVFGAVTSATGASNPIFTGPFVAANSKLYKNALKAAKEGSKLQGKVSKCYSKGASNVSKGKADGVDACINDPSKGAQTKFQAAIAKIASKAPGLPACHNYSIDGLAIGGLVKQFIPAVYCASPSGAFVDQASF